MATVVYMLCALTSIACAVLLYRGYRESRARLLFWSAVCFAGLALNNVLLFIDMRIIPAEDLSVWRSVPALLGLASLMNGLVWES